MIFYNSLLGIPVFDEYKNDLGIIREVAYSSDKKIVLGLILHEKGLFGKEKFLPIEYIKKINKTNIIVESGAEIREIDKHDEVYKMITKKRKLKIDTEVYSKKGKKLGNIKDIAFDFETGIIDGFVIGNGVIQDLISGRKIIKNEKAEFRKQVMIVDDI